MARGAASAFVKSMEKGSGMADMRLVVTGAGGRMGQTLIRLVAQTPGTVLAGAVERAGSPAVGQDAGRLAGLDELGVAVTDDPLGILIQAEGIIDFSAPAATIEFAALAAQMRIVHVIGTTGLAPDDDARIKAAARHAVIVKSGNMSLWGQPACGARATRRPHARRKLRYRDLGDAPQQEGGCALGNGAPSRPGSRRRAGHRARQPI